ncbi:MAG: hypothetical protein K5654_04695 [Lachnospiraceae bacterium]|nr:hypothetical protein [Lachnospiraceae bacterium]
MCIAQAGIIEPSVLNEPSDYEGEFSYPLRRDHSESVPAVQTHLQPDTINYINKTLYKGTKIYGRKDN